MPEKTNVMRRLSILKLPHSIHYYPSEKAVSGVEVAGYINRPADIVFKTLVTASASGAHYVFMVPVAEELDLKKAASAVSEKHIEMLKSKDLLGLTGYVHGGCSPIGMKKYFRTVVHISAECLDTIIFSGGRIGCQVEMAPSDLAKAVKIEYSDII